METSVLLAQIIGPFMLVVGIGILINLEHYRQLVADFGASPSQIFLFGTLALLVGLLIVCFHNVWEWRWPVVITVIGWLSILRGILRIAAPGFVQTMAERYSRNTNVVAASAVIALVLGAALSYFAVVPGA